MDRHSSRQANQKESAAGKEAKKAIEDSMRLSRGILADAEKWRKLDRELKESEERLGSIIRSTPDIILTVGRDFRIQFINRTVSGFSVEDTIGKSLFSFLPPEYKNTAMKAINRVFRKGKDGEYESEGAGPDGSVHWYSTRVGPVMGGGKVASVTLIARDMTKQRVAEEKLRESEERLRTVFEYAPDAYYINDMKGTFIDGNRAAEQLVGYRREELIGSSFLKLSILKKGDVPRAARMLAKNALGRPTGPAEFTLRRKDGKNVTVEIRTFPVRMGGRKVTLGIARDITERKKAEEEMGRRTEELERFNRLAVGRELKMVEMKKRMKELESRLDGR